MKHSVDIEKLRRLYEDGGLTVSHIARLVNTPQRTVYRYLVKAGVALRKRTDVKHTVLADRDWLLQRYQAERKSTTQIAADVGCQPRTVSWWLARHGIPARATGAEKGHCRNSTEVARAKQSLARRGRYCGPDHWNWKGGEPFRDLDRSRYRAKAWTKAVKDRDGWRCVECGSTDRLHAHHIKRWVDYPELRFDADNGITLCHDCHERAHGRRFEFRWRKYAKQPTSAPPPS